MADPNEYPDDTLTAVVGRHLSKGMEQASDKAVTRKAGSHDMLLHLVEGDWGLETDRQKELVATYLRRVLAHAEEQGVVVFDESLL